MCFHLCRTTVEHGPFLDGQYVFIGGNLSKVYFPSKQAKKKKNVHIFPVDNAYMHSIASIVEIIIICADWQ